MSRVVDGAEPMEFKALFKAWRDKYENTGIGKKYSGKTEIIVPCLGCVILLKPRYQGPIFFTIPSWSRCG